MNVFSDINNDNNNMPTSTIGHHARGGIIKLLSNQAIFVNVTNYAHTRKLV